MRQLTAHQVGPLNEAIEITPVAPHFGGAVPARYKFLVNVHFADAGYSPVMISRLRWAEIDLRFQDGPLEGGINGVSEESLIAVLIDRLEAKQAGEGINAENAFALDHLRDALETLLRPQRRQIAAKEAD
jgi:hypothetical protein